MSSQASTVLELLRAAIDGLDLPVDGEVLAEALGLVDRLNAKVTEAVGEHDRAEVWRDDGATSMTAWLRQHGRRSSRDAASCTKTARRLAVLPVTAAAYGDGRLSGGQVQAIVANLTDKTVGLFAEHEPEVVPPLFALSVSDTAHAMQKWARYAQAMLGEDKDMPEPDRWLHHSRTLDGRRETKGSFDPEGGSLIETALRLAGTDDVEGVAADP